MAAPLPLAIPSICGEHQGWPPRAEQGDHLQKTKGAALQAARCSAPWGGLLRWGQWVEWALGQRVKTFKSSSPWDVLIQRHYTSERALWFPFSLKCCTEAVLHNRVGVTVFFTTWRPLGLGMLTEWKNTCRSPVWSYARMGDSFSAPRLAAGRASSSPEQQKLCHTWFPHAQLLGECHPPLWPRASSDFWSWKACLLNKWHKYEDGEGFWGHKNV